jgi:hypothetical protein
MCRVYSHGVRPVSGHIISIEEGSLAFCVYADFTAGNPPLGEELRHRVSYDTPKHFNDTFDHAAGIATLHQAGVRDLYTNHHARATLVFKSVRGFASPLRTELPLTVFGTPSTFDTRITSFLHFGQLKLLCVTAEFLREVTSVISAARVLYVGCSPGSNIVPILDAFPEIEMVGVDPRPPAAELLQHPRFTYRDERVTADYDVSGFDVLISDMRTLVGHEHQVMSDALVVGPLCERVDWALVKFRPADDNSPIRFWDGELRYQPFVGPRSAEMRLMLRPGERVMREWDSNVLWGHGATFQQVYRGSIYDCESVTGCHCYDCAFLSRVLDFVPGVMEWAEKVDPRRYRWLFDQLGEYEAGPRTLVDGITDSSIDFMALCSSMRTSRSCELVASLSAPFTHVCAFFCLFQEGNRDADIVSIFEWCFEHKITILGATLNPTRARAYENTDDYAIDRDGKVFVTTMLRKDGSQRVWRDRNRSIKGFMDKYFPDRLQIIDLDQMAVEYVTAPMYGEGFDIYPGLTVYDFFVIR